MLPRLLLPECSGSHAQAPLVREEADGVQEASPDVGQPVGDTTTTVFKCDEVCNFAVDSISIRVRAMGPLTWQPSHGHRVVQISP